MSLNDYSSLKTDEMYLAHVVPGDDDSELLTTEMRIMVKSGKLFCITSSGDDLVVKLIKDFSKENE